MNESPAVLYVEDEPRSRLIMEVVLTDDMGLPNVTIFADSTDFLARALAIEPRPDIIFLDIHMKPHTGFEMLSMLRNTAHFAGVPVIAMTASVMSEEIDQLRTAGFTGCIAKPIDSDTFPQDFARLLRGERIWGIGVG
jgi:CheY-like chemotaxis protein